MKPKVCVNLHLRCRFHCLIKIILIDMQDLVKLHTLLINLVHEKLLIHLVRSHGKTMRQMVTETLISWCSQGEAPYPFSVIGDSRWQQALNISVDVMIESVVTAFVGIGVEQGSCSAGGVGSPAIVFSINATNNGLWPLTNSTAINDLLAYGNISIIPNTWYTLTLVA